MCNVYHLLICRLFVLGTFSDSESISRKNLAQSILAKERQVEVEKQVEVRPNDDARRPHETNFLLASLRQLIQMKLEFSEQALEQERTISNEAKLNVQLMTVGRQGSES